MMIAQTELTGMNWAEFGLAGVVIGALFVVLVLMFRSHRDERAEWRADHKEMHKESQETNKGIAKVVAELTEAVKDMGRNA